MKPYPHQIDAAKRAYKLLKQYGYVYIIGLPRSGKTYTAILTCEESPRQLNVLILTKKAAIKGIEKFTNLPHLKQKYTVTNYEQLGKAIVDKKGRVKSVELKYNPNDYDLVIIDESHNYGKLGKPANRYYVLKTFCKDKPHIHLSGTPYVESPNQIYHQMAISKYTPFKHKNFYEFFKEYGIPEVKYIGNRTINDYSKAKPELLDVIDSFTINIGGFEASIEDKLIYVSLPERVKLIYNKLVKDSQCLVKVDRCKQCGRIVNDALCQNCKSIDLINSTYRIICDTTSKLRTSLHQLEGGTLKIEDMDNDGEIYKTTLHFESAKLLWIMKNIPLHKKVGVMSHFKEEQEYIKQFLPQAEVYSSNAHAEGVDLSHLDYFIIYSQDYSGARHVQRRRRIANSEKDNSKLEVYYLLVKNAISEQVYKAVSNKLDFNNSVFQRLTI